MIIAYAPLLREQFNQLYRFGYVMISTTLLVEADRRELPDESDLRRVAEKIITSCPYEDEEEYLILQLIIEEVGSPSLMKIQIRDVRRVYPLSQRAKEFLESRLDTRIRFQPPIFQQVLENQISQRVWQSAEQAVVGLWHYFELDGSPEDVWSLIDKSEVRDGLNARLNGKKAHDMKDKEYWTYVIAYDRYEAFPPHTLGYFYDSGHIFGNYKGHSGFTGSRFHKFLEKQRMISPSIKYEQLKTAIQYDITVEDYRELLTTGDEWLPEPIRNYLLTPLFLIYKEELKDDVDTSSLNLLKNYYTKKLVNLSEFKILVALLGCFFGYRKFYDTFYEHPRLAIFKLHLDPINWENQKHDSLSINENHLTLDNSAVVGIHSSTLEVSPESTEHVHAVESAQVISESINDSTEVTETEQKDTDDREKPILIQRESLLPEINVEQTATELPKLGSSVLHETPLSRISKPKTTIPKPAAKKTDHEWLDWLDTKLGEEEYIKGMPLSEFTKHCKKKNQVQTAELIATDQRFIVRKEGRSDTIVRSIIYDNS